jgi:hypothetical protein
MAHQQPLLHRDKYVVEPVRLSVPGSATPIYLFFLSAATLIAYCALAFALPSRVPVFNEAAHVATLHAVAFFFIALFLAISARYVFGPDARLRPAFFPVSPLLAQLPFFLVTIGNALLLPVLGLEAWLRAEMAGHFSVLLLVQLLACAESACVLAGAAVVTYKLVQYVKVSSLPGGQSQPKAAAAEALSGSLNRRRSAALSREGSSSSAHGLAPGTARPGDSSAAAAPGSSQQPAGSVNQHSLASSQQLSDALEQVRSLQKRDELLGARIQELSAALADKFDAAGEVGVWFCATVILSVHSSLLSPPSTLAGGHCQRAPLCPGAR